MLRYRQPVDLIAHPDYDQLIDTPIDLTSIKEDLIGGNYATLQEFAKDVRLMFSNSRIYNTNKTSKVILTIY